MTWVDDRWIDTPEQLVARYAHAVDAQSPESVGALFTETGVLIVHDGQRLVGAAAIAEFIARSRKSRQGSSARLRHHVASVLVIRADATRAELRSYFTAYSAGRADHWGVYDDLVQRGPHGWRFVERRVTIEGADPAGWLASGVGPVRLDPAR